MLNLVNPEVVEGKPIMELIREFRRVQVSRFPINVHFIDTEAGQAKFHDSRFGKKTTLAKLWQDKDEKGGVFWILESRLIVNDRFVRGNDRRNQKQTKDPKKMLRYMRDYVLPWKPREIASSTRYDYDAHVSRWKYQAESIMRDNCYTDRDIVMEELLRMKAVGYRPQTQRFIDLLENGVPAYLEAQRRTNREVMRVHLFINPDESVEIFCDDKVGYAGINQGTTAYTSIEATPICIQQAVAMLRMLDDDGFLPEVGVKVDANNYWVEVFPDQ